MILDNFPTIASYHALKCRQHKMSVGTVKACVPLTPRRVTRIGQLCAVKYGSYVDIMGILNREFDVE